MPGMIFAAFLLRVYHLDYQSLWRDEVDAIRFSDGEFVALLTALPQQGHNGSLYFLALRGWRILTGDTEFAVRYLSVVAGILIIALVYRIGRQLRLGVQIAIIAALLAATAPYLIWYSQEAKMYSWLVCLVLTAIYAFQSALQAGNPLRWWFVFVIATSLSFYVHILSPLMLGVYALWAALQWQLVRLNWRGWVMCAGVLVLPYLPLLWWQAPLFLADFNTGHPFYPLSRQIELLLHFYSVGVLLNSALRWYLIAGTLILALAGILFSGKGVPGKIRFLLMSWFIFPALAVFLISLRVPVFEDRYLIYLAPAYYFLVATGLTAVRRYSRHVAIFLLVSFVAFNLRTVFQQGNHPIKADFRRVAAIITQAQATSAATAQQADRVYHAPSTYPNKVFLPLIVRSNCPTVMFQMPYLRHTFDYYFEGCYQPLDGVWTNDNRAEALVDSEMSRQMVGLQSLWLVVSEEDHWDARHLTRQWLDEHAALQEKTHLTGVDVYLYTLKNGD